MNIFAEHYYYVTLFVIILYFVEYSTQEVKNNSVKKITRKKDLSADLHYNLTVLMGYANNIFGTSMKVKQKVTETTIDYTSNDVYIDNLLIGTGTTPIVKNIKFKPLVENITEMNNSNGEQRSKRGVFHLYNMVSCATGCNPLSYKGYGCYCGFLGSGYAVDGIDHCCKNHDWCYDTANCPTFLEYFVPYFWKCYYNRPLCAIDHGEFGGPGSCAQRLCECDRVLSECLRRYPCPKSRAICRSSPLRLLQNAFMIFT